MSLTYTPRVVRSTWQPAKAASHPRRSQPAHRDGERAQPILPKGAIASTTAIALGFALMATNVPATIVRELSAPAEPTTDTGQLHTITLTQSQAEVAQVHDEWIAKQAAQAFKATPPAIRSEHAPAKVVTRATPKAVTAKTAAPAARPVVKSTVTAAKATIAKATPKKVVKKAASKKAVHKTRSVHHKAASIRTNTYFKQFNETGNERKHNAALIIEIGKKRGFSNRSIMVAVGTSIQESGLRNLTWGDRDSLGLFQQRPSMGWGSARQITDPVHAINKFYDSLARVRGRDSMSMMHAAMKVQIPDPYYYNRDWKWDRVATQIVNSYDA